MLFYISCRCKLPAEYVNTESLLCQRHHHHCHCQLHHHYNNVAIKEHSLKLHTFNVTATQLHIISDHSSDIEVFPLHVADNSCFSLLAI